MEENQYASLAGTTDYLQQWFQSNQHYPQAHLVTQYNQMVNPAYCMEDRREERIMTELSVHQETEYIQQEGTATLEILVKLKSSAPAKGKKRGRPSKQTSEENGQQKGHVDESAKKPKRTLDRFNGMSVAEVMTKTLPDIITHNLDILIIGINPGLLSAYKGRHYPNPGNHFWKCLFLSGLTDEQLNHMHDQTLPERYGIGFTNMVERTTPGSKDLSSKEIRDGGRQLLEKLKKYTPRIAAFNGKGIYEIFCKEIFGVKAKNLEFGLQPYKIPDTDTVCYLMPSSSPRCAQFPRAQDKVHFYIKLKELKDQLKGDVRSQEVQETRYTFDLDMAKEDAKRMAIKEEQHDPGYEASSCSATYREPAQPTSFYSSQTGASYKDYPSPPCEGTYNQWTMQPLPDQIPDIRFTSPPGTS
ncbi:G/T mismatch-specific thymine DNA glycosylase [Chanos chanos]|uniref:G/T mismatch-specific thymine DNA glycosylase n=1 Tax=Chanos chanos TaxID=29144 RepID=A0A6J2WP86_CHACN|nr:G/T mismatch-specific thymine DNA glycosylase-like [Chanos chanos]